MRSTVRLLYVGLATAVFAIIASTTVHASNAEGLAFLEENAKKEGVVSMPSGLQFKVVKKGKGIYHPLPGTPCSCHYAGTLIDGTPFDSSYDRGEPTTFAPNQVIKGWTEAMQMMVEGDLFELYIPSELAYGENGSPPKIPGGAVLVFKMEILEILTDDKDSLPLAITCEAATGNMCNDMEKIYLEKIATWDDEKKKKEYARLGKLTLEKNNMTPDNLHWIQRRFKLLQQLVGGGTETLSSASESEEL